MIIRSYFGARHMQEEIRCFISIDVEDPKILSGVRAVQSSLRNVGADLRIVGGENVHVTLKFLGNVQPEIMSKVKNVLSGMKFSPFTLELKGAGAFPNLNRISIIWVGIGTGAAEVEAIYDQVEHGMSGIGFARENRSFSPHITIARVRTGREREELAKLLGDLTENSFGSFTAEKVRLKQSILRPGGAEYRTLYEATGH
jgi:RNA 2',3'-cyclic 3'-phosphodiesterase